MDGSEPSTNGVSASNLYRLSSVLDDGGYATMAKQTVEAFATEAMQHPFLFTSLMPGVVAGHLGMKSVIITGEGEEVESAVTKSRLRLKPNTTIARLGGPAKSDWLCRRNKLLAAMSPTKNSVQVCAEGVCKEELGIDGVENALEH